MARSLGLKGMRRPPAASAALLHGALLLATGLWTVRRSKGAGACLMEIGGALVAAGRRGHVSRELRALGFGTAILVAGLDFWRARRSALPEYLLEGGAQLAMAGAWIAAQTRETLAARRPPQPAFA